MQTRIMSEKFEHLKQSHELTSMHVAKVSSSLHICQNVPTTRQTSHFIEPTLNNMQATDIQATHQDIMGIIVDQQPQFIQLGPQIDATTTSHKQGLNYFRLETAAEVASTTDIGADWHHHRTNDYGQVVASDYDIAIASSHHQCSWPDQCNAGLDDQLHSSLAYKQAAGNSGERTPLLPAASLASGGGGGQTGIQAAHSGLDSENSFAPIIEPQSSAPKTHTEPQPISTAPEKIIQRVKANKKERRRTQSINQAFSELRRHIPDVPSDTKLSKIKTLRLAISYISHLMSILNNQSTSTRANNNHNHYHNNKPTTGCKIVVTQIDSPSNQIQSHGHQSTSSSMVMSNMGSENDLNCKYAKLRWQASNIHGYSSTQVANRSKQISRVNNINNNSNNNKDRKLRTGWPEIIWKTSHL